MTAERPGLKLSEVSKLCGIDVDTLRALILDDQLQGVIRSTNGAVYLRPDAVPTYQDLVVILEEQFAHHLRRAQAAHRRVVTEVEAVGNDLEMAVEDPYAELGDDLMAFRSYPDRAERTTLTSAMHRLEMAVWQVRTYSDALRRYRRAV